MNETDKSAAILQIDLVSPTPVVFATGFRNPYDLLFHSNARLYVNDNGPNNQPGFDWGVQPKGSVVDPLHPCDPSTTIPGTPDKLSLVVQGGYYGHPNPARSECDFHGGPFYSPPIFEYGDHTSSNGIAEYTSSVFPALQGQIVTANWGSQNLVTIKLSNGGTTAAAGQILRAALNRPIDIAVRPSDGAIFIAEYSLTPATSAISVLRVKQTAPVDFSGTRQTSLTVFRPSTSQWYVRHADATGTTYAFGLPDDLPRPADYDGDGRADIAVFRPSEANWYISTSSSGYTTGPTFTFGAGGDIPVPADFDGDGRADIAVFRPSEANWYIHTSSSGYTSGLTITFGAGGDIPVPADFDGDGRADIALYRPSDATWYVRTSSSDYTTGFSQLFGAGGDVPLPGDFDGDGRADLAVFRPSEANWYVHTSSTNYTSGMTITWGAGSDIPRVIDYDGDGRADLTVFRPTEGTWYIRTSSSGWTSGPTIGWGTTGDIPLGHNF